MNYEGKAKAGLIMAVCGFVALLAYEYFTPKTARAKLGDAQVTVAVDVKPNRADNKSGHCRYLNTVDEARERETLTPALSEIMQVEDEETPRRRGGASETCGMVVEFEYQSYRYRLPHLVSVSGGAKIRDASVRDAGAGRIFVKIPGRGEMPAIKLGPVS